MKTDSIKRVAVGFMIAFLAIMMVAAITTFVISLLTKQKTPVTYVVVSTYDNRKLELPECDEPNITALQNVITDTVSYRCGKLGEENEVLILYD